MEILKMLPEWAQMALMFMGALVVVATFIVRLTPTKKDDLFVEKAEGWWLKLLSWAPTIGLNPKTKAIQDALKDVKDQVKVKADQPKQ